MDKSATRLLLISLLVYALAFLFFLFVSFVNRPPVDLIPSLQPHWLVYNAGAETIAHAPGLQVFAIVLCHSLLLRKREIRTTGASSYYGLVRASLVLIMLLTAAYTVGALVFEPQLRQSRQSIEQRSEMAQTYRSRGVEAFERGSYDESIRNLDRYLRVRPQDSEAREILQNARAEAAAEGAQEREPAERFRSAQEVQDFSVGELLERANRLLEEEDYFSAHYYANLALEQRPGFEPAQRLVTEARRGISNVDLSSREEEEQEHYRLKREGYTALHSDDNPIEAYTIFLGLRNEIPNDPDVQRYFQEAVGRIQEISFFLDEVRDIAAPPAATDVLITDQGEDGIRQFVHIESLYRLRTGSYAERVEVIGVTPEWEIAYHFMAPYAKFLDSHLALRAIERDNPGTQVTPTYYVEGRSEELRYVLRLDASPLQLQQAGTSAPNAGLLSLWNMAEHFPRVGYPSEPVYVELSMRLILPFSFLVLSVLAMAVSWRWRSRYISRPPIPALALLPALPFVLNYFTVLFVYGQRVVATFLLVAFGVSGGFFALIAVQAVLVIVSLAILALQARE